MLYDFSFLAFWWGNYKVYLLYEEFNIGCFVYGFKYISGRVVIRIFGCFWYVFFLFVTL